MNPESTQEPTPPRRRGCLRQVLLAALLVVALAGASAGAMYFLAVRPAVAQAEAAQASLQEAETELANLRPLVAENAELRKQVRQADQRLLVLGALVEVNAARVNVALREAEGAAERLAEADASLQALEALLAGDLAADVERMRGRLALAVEELARDAFAAQSDLDVLANDLSALAEALEG